MRRIGGPWGIGVFVAFLGIACGRETSAQSEAPGTQYHIRVEDLPKPFATASAGNGPRVVPRVAGAVLQVPEGYEVALWAEGFSDPRQATVAPNGDVLVVESGAHRISRLRDTDNDGKPDSRSILLARGLNRPFGIAFHDGYLYVGNETSVVRVRYEPGQETIEAEPEVVTRLPGGGHWTRNIVFHPDGKKLYVAVGSASNVAEEEPRRAAILEMNPDGTEERIYASGLRNPVGLGFHPTSGQLWTVVNERDGLGDDLPPDYATSVREGAFYGWPYAYIGNHPEPRMNGKRPDLVAQSVVPDVLIQAHSAPIGLHFYTGSMFPREMKGQLFVALHGSWNRSRRTGYKVIRVHLDENGHALGSYEDFLVGWSPDPDRPEVWGRPAGFAQLVDGSLLVLEDGGDTIWRVIYRGPVTALDITDKSPTFWGQLKTLVAYPPYPNPANPEVWIPFVLGKESSVEVTLFDAFGRRVRLLNLGRLAPGDYRSKDRAAYWDGTNDFGEPVASGLYLARLSTDGWTNVVRRVVLRR